MAQNHEFDPCDDIVDFFDWNTKVIVALCSGDHAKNLNYFRTLNQFQWRFSRTARQEATGKQKWIEALWNEKIDRLKEIIDGI